MPVIPTVIESDGRAERAFDIYSRLLRDRIDPQQRKCRGRVVAKAGKHRLGQHQAAHLREQDHQDVARPPIRRILIGVPHTRHGAPSRP